MSKKPATSKSKPKLDPGLLKAHYAYEAAINSNDTDKVMAMYDKDAEVLQPYGPIVSGHANIRKWVAGYFKQYKTHWKKVPLKNFVLGDYGFQRTLFPERRSILCAQTIQMILAFGFLALLEGKQVTRLRNFLGES